RLTKVRYRREHFDERTRMCYHQAPPAERVVVHVRGAGQAKPHLEHNPLSLLGTCYATPRRKLNDPAAGRQPVDSGEPSLPLYISHFHTADFPTCILHFHMADWPTFSRNR